MQPSHVEDRDPDYQNTLAIFVANQLFSLESICETKITKLQDYVQLCNVTSSEPMISAKESSGFRQTTMCSPCGSTSFVLQPQTKPG